MDNVETRATDLETRATNLETRATNLETRATNLETRAKNSEEDIEDINNDIEDINEDLSNFHKAVGLPLASGSVSYDDGIQDLYNQVIKNKDKLAVAASGHMTANSIWNQIKGDAESYTTLGEIEDVLGKSDDDKNTALNRIASLESRANDTDDTIGNQGINKNETLWSAINENSNLIGENANDIADTNARTKNLDGTDDIALYIVDKDKNVIAYIDEKGIHSIEFNLTNSEGSIETFSSLRQRVADVEEASATLSQEVGLPLGDNIETEYSYLSVSINNLNVVFPSTSIFFELCSKPAIS